MPVRPRLPVGHSHSEATTGVGGFLPPYSGATGQFLNGNGDWVTASGVVDTSGYDVLIWMGL